MQQKIQPSRSSVLGERLRSDTPGSLRLMLWKGMTAASSGYFAVYLINALCYRTNSPRSSLRKHLDRE